MCSLATAIQQRRNDIYFNRKSHVQLLLVCVVYSKRCAPRRARFEVNPAVRSRSRPAIRIMEDLVARLARLETRLEAGLAALETRLDAAERGQLGTEFPGVPPYRRGNPARRHGPPCRGLRQRPRAAEAAQAAATGVSSGASATTGGRAEQVLAPAE